MRVLPEQRQSLRLIRGEEEGGGLVRGWQGNTGSGHHIVTRSPPLVTLRWNDIETEQSGRQSRRPRGIVLVHNSVGVCVFQELQSLTSNLWRSDNIRVDSVCGFSSGLWWWLMAPGGGWVKQPMLHRGAHYLAHRGHTHTSRCQGVPSPRGTQVNVLNAHLGGSFFCIFKMGCRDTTVVRTRIFDNNNNKNVCIFRPMNLLNESPRKECWVANSSDT